MVVRRPASSLAWLRALNFESGCHQNLKFDSRMNLHSISTSLIHYGFRRERRRMENKYICLVLWLATYSTYIPTYIPDYIFTLFLRSQVFRYAPWAAIWHKDVLRHQESNDLLPWCSRGPGGPVISS
jgi:hypothetical protein